MEPAQLVSGAPAQCLIQCFLIHQARCDSVAFPLRDHAIGHAEISAESPLRHPCCDPEPSHIRPRPYHRGAAHLSHSSSGRAGAHHPLIQPPPDSHSPDRISSAIASMKTFGSGLGSSWGESSPGCINTPPECYNTAGRVNPQAHIHPGVMPGRGTPLACIRVPEETWKRFAELATANGTDRSAVLRQFIDWYLRVPGAKLPDRPPPANG